MVELNRITRMDVEDLISRMEDTRRDYLDEAKIGVEFRGIQPLYYTMVKQFMLNLVHDRDIYRRKYEALKNDVE